jgi:transmembrane sensor
MANQEILQDLADKWLKGTITSEESKLLNDWFVEEPAHFIEIPETYAASEEEHELKMWNILQAKIQKDKKAGIKRIMTYTLGIAASLLLVSLSVLYISRRQADSQSNLGTYVAKIVPGGKNAYLMLSDGSRLVLNGKEEGIIAKESGVLISQLDGGKLIYKAEEERQIAGNQPLYNKIVTPKGGEYQVVLPDGTNIWLNSASELKYPVSFVSQEERVVELVGEAYFEVFKDKRHPFRVITQSQQIKVLGTTFNVNGYLENSATKTTLLAGSVQVSFSGNSNMLVPGQQAELKNGNIKIRKVNTEDVIAWKNGTFLFKQEELKSIMNQLSRWYNVEVFFKTPGIAQKKFSGKMSKSTPLPKLLNTLQETGDVSFEIKGNKIIVL